jgi:PAS domain S-box-containing protein
MVPLMHWWDWYFYSWLIRPTWSPAELTAMIFTLAGVVLNLFAIYDAQADLHFLRARRLNGARTIVAKAHRRAAFVRLAIKLLFAVIILSSLGNPAPVARTNTPKLVTLGFIVIIIGLTWNDLRDRVDRNHLIETLSEREGGVDPNVDAVLTINEHSEIINASKGTHTIFGYDPVDVVGQRLSLLLPPREFEYHRRMMETYLETGTSTTLGRPRTMIGLDSAGETIPLEVTFVEIGFDSRRQWMAIVRRVGATDVREDG